MRILLVNYRYFISGGPEKYLFNIKEMLEQNGHEVIPFSIRSSKNVESEYSEYFVEPIGREDAVYYSEVKKTPKSVVQLVARSVYSWEVKRAVQKAINDLKPDLMYVIHFVNKLSPSIIIGAKELDIPVVLRISDYFLLCPRFDFMYRRQVCEDCLTKGYGACVIKRCVKGSLLASCIRALSMKIHNLIGVYDKVDAFIAPSEFLKRKLISSGFPKEKIHHIPTFTISASDEGEARTGAYGLYFGRISEEKGVETLIQAYEQMPNRQLKIVGDDTKDEAARLKEYVRGHGLGNVEFLGFKASTELEAIIRGSRFTLIPSIWYDNLPNTALESFQCSKPIIASNIGSLPELVVDNSNGYLFEPGNIHDLIEKIGKLDDDKVVERMGSTGKSRMADLFAPIAHYDKLMNVFLGLLSR